MKATIIEAIRGLLARREVEGVLALRQEGEHVGPFLFTDPIRLEELSLGDKDAPGDARYPLVKLLTRLTLSRPNDVFGVVVRGCDERALNRLIEDAVISRRKVVPIGFSCPPELAEACRCQKPWPDALTAGQRAPGVKSEDDDEASLNLLSRLQEWFTVSDRCIMCFGCRNICPVCYCKECTLEEENFIPQRELPTSREFLLTRAVHMVDRCVYCGLCEQACPADIPLKELYRLVAGAVGREMIPKTGPKRPVPIRTAA